MRIMTRALRFSNGKSRDDEQVLVRPTASRHAELVGRPTIGRPPGPVASLHEPPGSPGSGQASGVDAEIAVRAPLRKLLDAFVSTGQLAVGTKAGQPG